MTKLLWLLLLFPFSAFAQSYRDSSLSVDARVHDLLSRMTLEEKVAQLRSTWSAHPKINATFLDNGRGMDSLFGQGISMINPDFANTLEESIDYRNRIQSYLRSHTRLGIPAIFLDECHHGLLAQQTDVFPTSIGLACSWDTLLVSRIYTYAALQASVRGTSMVLAPVVDVTRDPRWGRTGETFGEDPYLNGLMGSAVVRGFQGSSSGAVLPGHVAATLKHFTGHGQPEAGQNQGPADFPLRVLRTFHMEPFRLIIARAHPAAIMPAYVEIDGVPSHANRWLLTDILRSEWGFSGILVSDWWAIDQLYQKHFVASSLADAAYQAFTAGVTVDLPMGANYAALVSLVRSGRISVSAIDSAVSRVLYLKFKLGLFDRVSPISLVSARSMIDQPSGRSLALQAAEESMVLLKNDRQILPLSVSAYHRIAVVGPCAAVNYTGDYSGVPVRNVSLLEGIRSRVGSASEVVYAKGVDLSLNGSAVSMDNFQWIDTLVAPSHDRNLRMIDSAVALARSCDVVICAVGQNEQYSREAEAPNHYGDVSTLDLPADQDSLVRALVATGKPVIVYLAHGRPLSISFVASHAAAILDGWFTGEEAGNAAAHILFGDVNPSGKLTISIPRSVGQIPIYYNHKPSVQVMNYVSESSLPLYPFGFGLSYTSFSYSGLRLSSPSLPSGGSVRVSVDVTNTGSVAGDEIVQLYVHPRVASVTQPVLALRDFSRVHLAPGEIRTASFRIDAAHLAYWTRDMKFMVEPGVVDVKVGRSSADVKSVSLQVD